LTESENRSHRYQGNGRRESHALILRICAAKVRAKEKWFQVTLKTDRFPTGMHGRNLAFGNGVAYALCSPQPVLPGYGSTLWCAPASLSQ
jgi:hypothetical protein